VGQPPYGGVIYDHERVSSAFGDYTGMDANNMYKCGDNLSTGINGI
jgi:hypothetical protein